MIICTVAFMPSKPVLCRRIMYLNKFGCQPEMQVWLSYLDHYFYIMTLMKCFPNNFASIMLVSLITGHFKAHLTIISGPTETKL